MKPFPQKAVLPEISLFISYSPRYDTEKGNNTKKVKSKLTSEKRCGSASSNVYAKKNKMNILERTGLNLERDRKSKARKCTQGVVSVARFLCNSVPSVLPGSATRLHFSRGKFGLIVASGVMSTGICFACKWRMASFVVGARTPYGQAAAWTLAAIHTCMLNGGDGDGRGS